MDDIAVIGIGLRFPGNATDPEGLWDVLERGESQWAEIPQERVNIEGYYHPSGDRIGSIPFRGAHLIKGDIAAFDAAFFSIASDEAHAIDPQQRMLLEVSYEALENAGLRREDIQGTDTGVYVGSFVKDYEQVCLRDSDWSPQYAATGNGVAIMANRLSYFYDLHGPSITIDTGCSGSLVSVHLGAQSLRTKETSLAIVAGAGMILTPTTMMPMTALNFLSPDGKCFTFDARANGYGRGEGVGVVVLKRLSDAIRDNDTIRAVIRGSSVNQDGRTTGITLPSKDAQVANIRSAYANAGLGFDQTAYVECHGTGTQAGDWRELKAISETLADSRPRQKPLVVGSIKPNIGHLEGAAGVAGIIKGVLVLEKGKIPPNINFETGNPTINFDEWKVKVPLSAMNWPLSGTRRVSVNCFGFGGTNAHVILDEAPQAAISGDRAGSNGSANDDDMISSNQKGELPSTSQLFCYSASEKSAVARTMSSHSTYVRSRLMSESAETLRDYAFTLGCRRSNLEYRSFLVARSASDLLARLEEAGSVSNIQPCRRDKPRIAFVFSGQGSQWAQMGLDLMPFEVFNRSLREASGYIMHDLQSPFNLLCEILRHKSQSVISFPYLSQPATTAIQVALVDLLHSFGIKPSHVVGHSSGEIAAAYAAGAITRFAAWEIAYFRGMAANSINFRAPKLKGTMMAVGMSAEKTARYLALGFRSAEVACINSPVSTTISGRVESIESIARDLAEKKIFHRVLEVSTAYHSSHMRLVAYDYKDSLGAIEAQNISPDLTMISSVTAKEIRGSELGPHYWAENMVSAVRFMDAMSAVLSTSVSTRPNIILEIGPREALRTPISDIMSSVLGNTPHPKYHSAMHSKGDGMSRLLSLVGRLWAEGCPVNLNRVLCRGQDHMPRCLTDLPPYPWNHDKAYWHESHLSKAARQREFPRQDLIGSLTADSIPYEPRWRGFLRVGENPWIQEHQMQKTIVYPAAGMIAMVLEGAKQIRPQQDDFLGYEITNMAITRAMIIPNTAHGLEVALNVKVNTESEDKGHEFCIYSKPLNGSWQQHANGLVHWRLAVSCRDASSGVHDAMMQRVSRQSKEKVEPRQLYELLDTMGMTYGPTFQNMLDVYHGVDSCTFSVRVPDTKSKMPAGFEYPHIIHPATLDSMFHSLFAIEATPMVPTSFESIFVSDKVSHDGPKLFSGFATAQKTGQRRAQADLILRGSESAEPDIVIQGFQLTAIDAGGTEAGAVFLPQFHNLSNEIVWKEDVDCATMTDTNQFIDLLAHKHPALSILQIGGSCKSALEVLERLAPNEDEAPRLARFTILPLADSSISAELARRLRARKLMEFIEFKQRMSESDNDYHLIISFVDEGLDQNDDIRGHLKVGGAHIQHRGSACDLSINGSKERAQNLDAETTLSTDVVMYRRPAIMSAPCPPIIVLSRNAGDDQETAAFVTIIQNIESPQRDEILHVTSVACKDAARLSTAWSQSIVISLLDIDPSGQHGRGIVAWEGDDFELFKGIQKAAKGIVWVTRSSHMNPVHLQSSAVVGLARTLMSEDPRKLFVTVDLGVSSRLDDISVVRNIMGVFFRTFCAEMSSAHTDTEFAEQDGKMYIARMQPIKPLNQIIEGRLPRIVSERPFHPQAGSHEASPVMRFSVAEMGLSEGAWHYTELPPSDRMKPDEIDIAFCHTTITSRDVDVLLSGVDGDSSDFACVGLDLEGRVTAVGENVVALQVGDEVATLAPVAGGTFQSSFRVDIKSHYCVQRGRGQVLAPSLLTSAYYAVVHMGRASRRKTVLIQGGASAYGLAAVEIAKLTGVEIFATVIGQDCQHQRSILQTHGLPAASIFNANDHELVGKVRALSGGEGVDLIYDTLEHSMSVDLQCVKACGIIVRLAQQRRANNGQGASMKLGDSSVTVVNFDLRQLLRSDHGFVMELFESASQYLDTKQWDPAGVPTVSTEFGIDKLHEALQYVQKDSYGDICTVSARREDNRRVRVVCNDTSRSLADAIDPHGTYLLAGGLGGLGRSIAELLVANGAKHLAFLCRSGLKSSSSSSSSATASTQAFVDSLQNRGVHVGVYCSDICEEIELNSLLANTLSIEMPPIRGIFQCAAVIEDAVFDNMDYADWRAAIRPKTHGAWNLFKVLSKPRGGNDPSPFFIFLSSSAGVIGNRGQANYAAGNSFQDALAHHCRLQGHHAVSIDLGPVLGAGMLTESEDKLDKLRASGFYGIRHEDFLTVIKHAVTGEMGPSRVPTPAQIILGVGTGGLLRQNKPADPYWSRTALFSYLNLVDMPPPDLSLVDDTGSQGVNLAMALSRATSTDGAADLIRAGLANMLAQATQLLPEEIDVDKAPSAYGVDSLVAVGVRNWVLANCTVEISTFEVLSNDSIAQMAVTIAQRGKYGG